MKINRLSFTQIPKEPKYRFQIAGRFDYVSPALALLCDRQLAARINPQDQALIRACVLVHRFRGDRFRRHESIDNLNKYFSKSPAMREAAFWIEVAIMRELIPKDDEVEQFLEAEEGSIIESLTEIDRPWLEKTLGNKAEPSSRLFALQLLVRLWNQRGRVDAESEFLFSAVADDESLTAQLTERTA